MLHFKQCTWLFDTVRDRVYCVISLYEGKIRVFACTQLSSMIRFPFGAGFVVQLWVGGLRRKYHISAMYLRLGRFMFWRHADLYQQLLSLAANTQCNTSKNKWRSQDACPCSKVSWVAVLICCTKSAVYHSAPSPHFLRFLAKLLKACVQANQWNFSRH